MRFISNFGAYGVQIVPQRVDAFASGGYHVTQEPIYAMFRTGMLFPHEYELAVAHWHSFNGFYQLEDEVTIVPPDYRIGVFDSLLDQADKGYSDEVREEIERALIRNGEQTNNVIPVPATMVPAPWPRYDEWTGTPRKLIDRLIEDGHDLSAVLEYERANLNRPAVVEALEGLIADPDALLELQPQPEEIVG